MAQLGDLIVSGTSRFLNKINGDITGDAGTVNNHTVEKDVPSNAVFTDNSGTYYGTCDTAAGTSIKTVTISNDQNFTLQTGVIIGVKFTNGNTASSVTLNVNSSGTKNIVYKGNNYSGNIQSITGIENTTIFYMYNGTAWDWLSTDVSVVQQSEIGSSTNGNYQVLLAGSTTTGSNNIWLTRKGSLKFDTSTGNLQATKLNGVTIGDSPKFTDTNNMVTQTETSTNAEYEVLFSGTADNTTRTEGARKYSNLTFNPSTGLLASTKIKCNGIMANMAGSNTAGGVALYSDNDPTTYGIAMRGTGTSSGQLGKHGYVQGNWAGYFNFTGDTNRGYIFRHAGTAVASVSGLGHMVLNGSVTVGGNTTNTSGARMEYNDTQKCVEFTFV